MLKHESIFDLCRKAGRLEYNTPGELFMPELEASYLIKCLRRSRYDEGKGRLRRHLIIISPPDTVKSSITEEFLKVYCDAISRISREDPSDPRPTYLDLQGGTSWEALRGGYADGQFTHPQLHDVDFLYASEFFSFFGHTPNEMMGRIDQFNVALEEGRVTFNQKTAKAAPKKAREEFASWCETNGIHFNFDECTFEYDCLASAIFCTRPFTDKQEKAIDHSGFLGRNAVIRWDPDDQQIYDYYDNQFGKQDPELASRIKDFNRFAWRTEFKRVVAPPMEMVDDLVRKVNARYRSIGMRTGRSFASVRPKRDRQNITQLIVAFAVARHLQEEYDRDPSNNHPVIHNIEYTPKDTYSVYSHYNSVIQMVEKHAVLAGAEDPVLEDAASSLVEFVRQKAVRAKVTIDGNCKVYGADAYETFLQPIFIEFLKTRGCNTRQAAYRRVAKLREAGHITQIDTDGKAVMFQVKDHIIEDAGFYPSATISESHEMDGRFGQEVIDGIMSGDPYYEEQGEVMDGRLVVDPAIKQSHYTMGIVA